MSGKHIEDIQGKLNSDLERISAWLYANKLTLNEKKNNAFRYKPAFGQAGYWTESGWHQTRHNLKHMNPKNAKKSPIHENADANITCDFGDGDISRSTSFLSTTGLNHATHKQTHINK